MLLSLCTTTVVAEHLGFRHILGVKASRPFPRVLGKGPECYFSLFETSDLTKGQNLPAGEEGPKLTLKRKQAAAHILPSIVHLLSDLLFLTEHISECIK